MFIRSISSILAMTIIMLYCTNRKIFIISSSMVHISWIIIRVDKIKLICIIYLLIYSIIITPIVTQFKKFKYNSLVKQEVKTTPNQIRFKINIIRLAGLPPLSGFFLKALVLYNLIIFKRPTKIAITLLMVATGAFYAYRQIIIKLLLLKRYNKTEKKDIKIENTKKAITWNSIFPIIILIK